MKKLSREEKFMKEALRQAQKAYLNGDVPIGCVIVRDERIIARGYNQRVHKGDVIDHAEIIALSKACRKTGDWRLEECELYVTLEPCPMCAGAIVQARIPKVYICTESPKSGCAGSVIDLFHQEGFNHQVEAVYGTLHDEGAALLKRFFRDLRQAHPKKIKYVSEPLQ